MPVETMIVPVWASITFPPVRAKVPRGRLRADPAWARDTVQKVQAGATIAYGPPRGDVPASVLAHEAMGRLCPYAEWFQPLLWAVDDQTFSTNPVDSDAGWSLARELVRSWQAWNRRPSVADPFRAPDAAAIAACEGVVLVMGVLASSSALHEALSHLRRNGPARPVCVLAFAVEDASVLLTSQNKAEVIVEGDGTMRSAWMQRWEPAPKLW